MAAKNLTAQRLREVLHYDPTTGIFTRIVCARGVRAGTRCESISVQGYARIGIDKLRIGAHRLAWLYMHGAWPNGQIDHINGNRADNRLENLRDVNISVNRQNRHWPDGDSKTGVLGVTCQNGRWIAQIKAAGKRLHLGSFDTAALAHEAYLAAKRKHHAGCTI